MLTLHTADLVLPGDGVEPLYQGGVLIGTAGVLAVGDGATLHHAFPAARIRAWPGLLTPGLAHRRAATVLETAYHPDPREASSVGTEPVGDPAELAALGMDDARWGESARRGAQRMMRCGTTAVAGPFRRGAVRTAVARLGLSVTHAAAGPGPLSVDPLAGLPAGASAATAFASTITPGARADLAVFELSCGGREAEARPPLADAAAAGAGAAPVDGTAAPAGGRLLDLTADLLAALAGAGGAGCVATVLDGRLVYRRR